MTLVTTDDNALRLKGIFKGNAHFTIPFDARYGAWVAGVGLGIMGTLVMWPVTRAFHTGGPQGGALLTVIAVAACGALAMKLRGHVPGRRWLTPFGLVPVIVMVLGGAATSGGPTGALLALGTAVGTGVGGSVLVARKAGAYVSAVTPLRYQLAAIRAEATAPRRTPPVAHPIPAPVHVETGAVTTVPVTGPTVVPDP